MAYDTNEARGELLDAIAAATDEIGAAVTALGDAYELLDDLHADELEDQLFRPTQLAYGRLRRTHAGFAERHGLPGRDFAPPAGGAPSTGAKGFIEHAVEAVARADAELSTLQDSMMPVEVGDTELRAGLSEVRELLGGLRRRAREVVRTIGR